MGDLTNVAAVTLGAITTELIQYGAIKASDAGVDVGGVGVNVADAAGILSSLAEITAGWVFYKPTLTLFGAGGLAISAATLVGKALIVHDPLGQAKVATAKSMSQQQSFQATAKSQSLLVGGPIATRNNAVLAAPSKTVRPNVFMV